MRKPNGRWQKNSKEKGVIGMKRIIGLGLAILLVTGVGSVAFAATTDTVDILVTPVVTASLVISPDTYDFGNMDVSVSSNSATALTLTNDGNIDIKVQKKISDEDYGPGDGYWVADSTNTTKDHYVLYCGTAAARVDVGNFADGTLLGAEAAETYLTGSGSPTNTVDDGVVVPATTGNTVDLWFKLTMPTSVTNGNARTMRLTFTASSQ